VQVVDASEGVQHIPKNSKCSLLQDRPPIVQLLKSRRRKKLSLDDTSSTASSFHHVLAKSLHLLETTDPNINDLAHLQANPLLATLSDLVLQWSAAREPRFCTVGPSLWDSHEGLHPSVRHDCSAWNPDL
jgi:hypothetical protein